MITIRKASERGHTDIGWLDSYHSFSFGDYMDPENRGFRVLRVINDDRVMPSEGFDTHPHRDMEILTYILEGALEHKDSMGTGSIIRPGDVQRMTAGTGVLHSERNPSDSQPVRLLQIWIFPDKKGLKPGYEQKNFSAEQKPGRLLLVASPDGKEGSVTLHQDARLYSSVLDPGQTLSYENPEGRYAWLQMARGTITLNGNILEEGDGAAISGKESLDLDGKEKAEFLLFDLP